MHKQHLVKLLGLVVLAAIGVMAVGASAAQAKWLLLLKKPGAEKPESVLSAKGDLLALPGLLEAENGLKIKCEGGTGKATIELKEESKKATGSAEGTFTKCVWEGAEKTCTINDGGVGLIKVKGNGELSMVGEEVYVLATSAAFTTIKTEGKLCTVPKEEVVSGTGKCHVLNALTEAQVHLCHLEPGSLKLGESPVKKLEGEVHITDENPEATFAIHLVNL